MTFSVTNSAAATYPSSFLEDFITFDSQGSTLLVCASVSNTGNPAQWADNLGNVWSSIDQNNTGPVRMRLGYCIAPVTGATHTIIGTATAAGSICVIGFAGASFGSVQFEGDNAVNAASNSLTFTPSGDNELVVAALGWGQDVSQSATFDAPMIVARQLAAVSGTNPGVAVAYLLQSTAVQVSPTGRIGSATDTLIAAMSTQATNLSASRPLGSRTPFCGLILHI